MYIKDRLYLVSIYKDGEEIIRTYIETDKPTGAVHKVINSEGWSKKLYDIDRINETGLIPLSYTYSGTAKVQSKQITYYSIL